jgi:tape measure domain-containing protein
VANTADFELRLKQKVSSPADAAKTAIDKVKKSFEGLEATGTKAMRDLMRSVEQQAAAAARADRQQQQIANQQARRNIQNYRLIQQVRRRSEAERAREQQQASRAAEQKARAEQRAADQAIKARQRDEKHAAKVSALASGRARSDAAFLAHKKVLDGGVADELRSSLGSRFGISSGMSTAAIGAGVAAAGVLAVVAALNQVVSVALRAASAVSQIALSFAAASIEGLKFAQRSELALGNLLHQGQNARAEFDEVRAMAQRLGLGIEDTVHSFQKLLAAQFEVGRAKELIRMSSDLQGIGASAEEVKRSLLAITQIKSKGRLMAEEMLQLQEAGISSELVYDALGRRLGKTRDELRKLQEAGKLDAATGIEAILEAVRKKTGTTQAGELGAKFAATTLEGLQAQLTGGIQNTFINIGRRVAPILMPVASKIVAALMSALDNPRLKAAGERLLIRLERFGAWVIAHMPQIEKVFTQAVDGVALAIDKVVDVIDFFRENSTATKAVLYTLLAVGSFVAGAITAVAYSAAQLATPFVAAAAAIGAFSTAVSGTITYLMGLFPRFVEAGRNMVSGLIQGITSSADGVLATVRGLAGSIASVFTGPQGIQSASPSKLFAGFGKDTVAGYVQGLQQSQGAVGSAIAQVIPFAANDNAFTSRAATSVPGVAAPITPAAPGTIQPQGAAGAAQASKNITVSSGAIVLNIHTQAKDSEGVRAAAGEGVEDALMRVLGGL